MKIKISKKIYLIPLFTLLFIGLIAVGGSIWFRKSIKPVSTDSVTRRFVISSGLTAEDVGQKLYKEGFIRNPLAFKIYVQVKGTAKLIQPGIFNISPSQSPLQIADRLIRNPDELRVTIPEGLRSEEMVNILISGLEVDSGNIANYKKDFLNKVTGKEGYLFPDTYDFFPGTTPDTIILRLTQTLNSKINENMGSDITASGKTMKDILIMASLIERETKTNDERPVVAGILWKRLDNNWPLQVDASLQYALGTVKCRAQVEKCNWWPAITKNDLEINSPYNTYKFTGLPPTPICNPGLSSISAAIYPQDSDYWFYLHDAEGNIHYAKTIEEHNLNVGRYLGK